MDDALLLEAARRFGTPLYLYDLRIVRHQAGRLRSALPDTELLYAVKANPARAMIREAAALGFGAEVITLGELERAHRAGVSGGRMLLGGPGQDEVVIERALELQVGLVSLDSISQWKLWKPFLDERLRHAPATSALPRFLVRINPQLDPRTHPHLATGAADSKFGTTPEEGRLLAAELSEVNLLEGFHFHIGSQISSVDSYRPVAEIVGQLFSDFPAAATLDLGGGFAVPGFRLEEFGRFARGLADRAGARLLLEPGRFLVAEAGILLTSVRHLKKGAVGHAIVDAGMADLLRPALYDARHPVRRVGGGDGSIEWVDVDGPLCENADRLAAAVPLPADLRPGDLLAVEQVGAYGMTMASNYASSLRPAEAVFDGEEVRLVRARETVEDLMRLELG